jgi:hypothetical protein
MAILLGTKKRHTNVRIILELTLGPWEERFFFSSYIRRTFKNSVSDLHSRTRSNFHFVCMYIYERNSFLSSRLNHNWLSDLINSG